MLGWQKNPGSSSSAPRSAILESSDESGTQEDQLELRSQSCPPQVRLQMELFQAVEYLDAMLCHSRWLNFESRYRVSRTRSGIVQSAVPLLSCVPDKRKGSIPGTDTYSQFSLAALARLYCSPTRDHGTALCGPEPAWSAQVRPSPPHQRSPDGRKRRGDACGILRLRIFAWMHSLRAGTTPLTDTRSKSSTDSTSSGTDTSSSFPVPANLQTFKGGIGTAPTPKFRVGA